MDRNKILTLIVITALAITTISVIALPHVIFLPVINLGDKSTRTPDPCNPNPYPLPTPLGCPTATATYSPYPAPPTQTPWVITATPGAVEKFLYLPVVRFSNGNR